MRIIVLTALALSLGTLPAGIADAPAAEAPIADASIPIRTVTLDPRHVASRAHAGEAVTLPTMWGEVTLDVLGRVSPGVRVLHQESDGSLVDQGDFLPDVWRVASKDKNVTGVLLADGKQVRATLVTPEGRSTIEPGLDGIPSGGMDVLHRMYSDEPTRVVAANWEAPPVPGVLRGAPTPPSILAVSKTMVAYVDDEFAATWGGLTWPNQVSYLTSWLNGYMDDVQLTYGPDTMVKADPGTTSNSPWSSGFDWLDDQSLLGMNTKVLWSHVDYDGCTVGQAAQPGNYAMLQTTDDACHLWNIVDTDFERAYFMAHELGHNNNGCHEPECSGVAWSASAWSHTHREILYAGGQGHLHECWGSANANRMTAHLGTSFVGSACS